MRLLICGGREFDDVEYAVPLFHRVHTQTPVTLEICGLAKGGDTLGRVWAEELGIPVLKFPADWQRFGRKAGPLRNQQMLDEGKPDKILALPGGTGTAHMVRIAREAGVPCDVYEYLYFRSKEPEWWWLSNFYESEQIDPITGIRYPSGFASKIPSAHKRII